MLLLLRLLKKPRFLRILLCLSLLLVVRRLKVRTYVLCSGRSDRFFVLAIPCGYTRVMPRKAVNSDTKSLLRLNFGPGGCGALTRKVGTFDFSIVRY